MESVEEQNSFASVTQLAKELGFQKVHVQLEMTHKTGFLGEVFKFKIIGERNGTQECLPIVAKHMPQMKFHLENGVHEFYCTEAYVYSKIFTAFDKMQEDSVIAKGFKHLTVLKSILEPTKELVIMEDLTVKGFQNCKLEKKLDLNHAKLILEEIGKLHALSFALKHQNRQKFEDLTSTIQEPILKINDDDITRKLILSSIKYTQEILDDEESKEKLLKLELEAPDHHPKMVDEDRFSRNAVLTHGDLWFNNVLYKYNGDTVGEVIILDWQTPRVSSPVMDVLFFMLTSLDDQVRSNHFQQLLSMYYDALASFMRELKCNPDEIYSHDEYRQDIKKMAKVALTHALVMLPVFANNHEDVVLETIDGEFVPIKYSDTYISRVRGGIKDMIAHNLL